MSQKDMSLEEVCKEFNSLSWHDSKLIAFRVFLEEDGMTHNVEFDMNLILKVLPNKVERKNGRLILKDCRIIKIDLDLLGKYYCGGDIAYAISERNSDLKRKIETEQLSKFDLPQEDHPLEDYLHFRISLIHPGGEVHAFAKNFELEIDPSY